MNNPADRKLISLVQGCVGYYFYNEAWHSYELRAGDELEILEEADDTVLVRSSLGPHYARSMFIKAEDIGKSTQI